MEGRPKIARVRCTSAVWVLLLCLLTRAGAGIGRNAVPATRGGEIEQWKKSDCAHHVRKWGSLLGIPGGVDGDGCERTGSRDPAESVRVRMGGFGGLLGAWERTGSVDREWLRGGAWSSDDADEKRRTYAPSARIDHALWRSFEPAHGHLDLFESVGWNLAVHSIFSGAKSLNHGLARPSNIYPTLCLNTNILH